MWYYCKHKTQSQGMFHTVMSCWWIHFFDRTHSIPQPCILSKLVTVVHHCTAICSFCCILCLLLESEWRHSSFSASSVSFLTKCKQKYLRNLGPTRRKQTLIIQHGQVKQVKKQLFMLGKCAVSLTSYSPFFVTLKNPACMFFIS